MRLPYLGDGSLLKARGWGSLNLSSATLCLGVGRVRFRGPLYQVVDDTERVVGMQQGRAELGHPIAGLAVAIETDANPSAAGREDASVLTTVWDSAPLVSAPSLSHWSLQH